VENINHRGVFPDAVVRSNMSRRMCKQQSLQPIADTQSIN